jgi:hypothetical protein
VVLTRKQSPRWDSPARTTRRSAGRREETAGRGGVVGLQDHPQLVLGGLLGFQQPVPVTVSALISASSGDGTVSGRQCTCSWRSVSASTNASNQSSSTAATL